MATSQYKNFYIQTQSCQRNEVDLDNMTDSLKTLCDLASTSEVKIVADIWQEAGTQVNTLLPKNIAFTSHLHSFSEGVTGRSNHISSRNNASLAHAFSDQKIASGVWLNSH